jgi:hypothetical protein
MELETTEELLLNIKISITELNHWLVSDEDKPIDREALAYVMWAARQFYRDNKHPDTKF